MLQLSYEERESRVMQAYEAFQDGEYTNIALCAREFGCSWQNLRNRLNGMFSKSTRFPTCRRHTDAQEQVIVDYIIRLDDMNMSLTIGLVVDAANRLLPSGANPVGQHWFRRFYNRHPELRTRRQTPIAVARKDASSNIEVLELYFMKSVVDEKGIQIEDHWNMDETGFRIGCGRAHTVVTRSLRGVLQMADPENRDYITAAEAASAAGESIPPMIITKGINILARWIANDIDDDTLFNTSDTGYSNDDLAIDWLHHFIRCTRGKRKGRWILLIIDGFGSHMTLEFLDLATNNDIILFKLPPHSTHITQPLDVGVFQAYKSHHGRAVDRAVRRGDDKFDRMEFFAAFQAFRAATFKPATLRHAFARTGIVPFNPAVVIDPLRAKFAARQAARGSTITPPPQNSDECFIRTPQGPESIKKVINHIRDFYGEEGTFNVHPDLLFRLLRRVEEQADTLKLIEKDLNECLTATAARKERRQQRGTVAANNVTGPVTARDCRAMVSMRAQRIAELAVAKAEQEVQRVAKKLAADALKAAKKKATETTRAAKRSEKRSQDKTRKEAFAARKAIAAAKKQEREAKKIANATKQAAKTAATKVTAAEAEVTKDIEADEEATHNQELHDALWDAQELPDERNSFNAGAYDYSNLYPLPIIPQYTSPYATTTLSGDANALASLSEDVNATAEDAMLEEVGQHYRMHEY